MPSAVASQLTGDVAHHNVILHAATVIRNSRLTNAIAPGLASTKPTLWLTPGNERTHTSPDVRTANATRGLVPTSTNQGAGPKATFEGPEGHDHRLPRLSAMSASTSSSKSSIEEPEYEPVSCLLPPLEVSALD